MSALRRDLRELEEEEEKLKLVIREEESLLRGARKTQSALLRAQRGKEKIWEGLQAQAAADQRECEETVQELKDQIKDLAIYSRTQSEVDQSPHKDEIREGTVVTSSPSPSTSSSSYHKAGGSGSGGRRGRGGGGKG